MPLITTRVTYPSARWSYSIQTANPTVLVDIVPRQSSDEPLVDGIEQVIRNSNPYWKTQVAKRVDASTYYFRSEYNKAQIATAIFRGSNTPLGIAHVESRYRLLGQFPNGWSPVTDASLDDLALTRLKRKLKKHLGQFDSMVPLLELKDLRTTVKSLAELTTKAVVTLADIKKTKGRSAFKYASKAWLTYGFGVRPLMEDVQSLCGAISKYLLRSDHTVVLGSGSKRDWHSTNLTTGLTGGLYHTRTQHAYVHQKLSYRYKAGFSLKIRSSNDYGVMEQFGLEPPSLIPALWEAMAFSWVIDYFTNVGELLDDTFNSPPGNCLYVVRNSKYTATLDATTSFVPNSGVTVKVNRPGISRVEYYRFERQPFGNALPYVGFRIRSPDEITNYAVPKLLNLVSILASGGSPPALRGRNPL